MGGLQRSWAGALPTVALLAVLSTLMASCSASTGPELPASAAPAQTTGSTPGSGPDGQRATSSDGSGEAAPLASSPTDNDSATGVTLDPVTGLPHFQGNLDLRIVAGTRVIGYRGCEPADPDRGRLCSADGLTLYLTYPESGADVTLMDARMQQNAAHTSWTVTLTVDKARAAKRAGRTAVSVSGSLLFVGPDEQVVLTHRPVTSPEPSIRNGRITFPSTTKAEAWDLVESMETLA